MIFHYNEPPKNSYLHYEIKTDINEYSFHHNLFSTPTHKCKSYMHTDLPLFCKANHYQSLNQHMNSSFSHIHSHLMNLHYDETTNYYFYHEIKALINRISHNHNVFPTPMHKCQSYMPTEISLFPVNQTPTSL